MTTSKKKVIAEKINLLMIKKIDKSELNAVLQILQQDSLRYCDGQYPEQGWIGNFLTDDKCFAFGFYVNERLTSVLLSEKLSFKGCMLWYIATCVDAQGNGYGSKLLEYFETYAKKNGVEWIFLNATEDSMKFYKKNRYITSDFSKVFEHFKEL